ncbi:MAG: TerB family tellurite resistance protein, partial [Chloroflexota bacterium]|nr:TerB family tellurite resistance protein [Chloroflexota bacterium]
AVDAPAQADTATVRRIVAAMEALPEAQRRYIAGFAYILGRTAHADLLVTDEEVALMERTVTEVGGLPEPQAVLVVQIARSQNELYGGTEDYLVTREFRQNSTDDQRLALLRCAFAVGAAEGSITAEESAELNQIAKELDLSDEQLAAIRGEFTAQFAAIQQMREAMGRDSDA